MKITRNNYEAFFLDYHEGNLDDKQRREVLDFLNANPDLKEEFESFEMISLVANPVQFTGKEKLKKNAITDYNYKTWLVAYIENDLTPADKKEVEQFLIQHPGYQAEFDILKRTKVQPDLSVRFANRQSLKKGGLVIPMWVKLAAAACLVIGLISYLVIRQEPKNEMATDHKLQQTTPIADEKMPVEKTGTDAEGEKHGLEKNSVPVKTPRLTHRQPARNIVEEKLARVDSVPSQPIENKLIEEPLAVQQPSSTPEVPVTIIINEHQSTAPADGQKMVVLDDNDLAELGLKENKTEDKKSLLADAVNGVGKIFGVNAHYGQTQQPLQSKYTETLALGPVAITRTVLR